MVRRRSTEDDYRERLNRVMDVVHARLDAPPSLGQLAKVAAFSPFHFHRVFRGVTGETVHAFVLRARVERAALLLGRAASVRRLTDLALELGFSSGAELSRAFRARFGVTPSRFRAGEKRKKPQVPAKADSYRVRHERARVIERPAQRITYVRVTNPFAAGALVQAGETLFTWAKRHGVPATPVLGVSHDDPDVVPLERCRYDVALVGGEPRGGGVSARVLAAATWVELEVEGTVEAMSAGWSWLFSTWLPRSGFDPAPLPGVERYEHGVDLATWAAKSVVLCLPLESR